MTDRLDDGGVRRRGARDGGDDARRGGRHHNLYARENTRARARVVSHAFALARASAARPARPAPTESSSRRVVTHRVLSIHIHHPIASDPSMHRARARPMPPSSIARSRARMSSDVFLARRLVLLLVVVARPSSVDVDRVLARALARRARARVPRDERTNERRRSNDRTIDRTRATRRTLFFSAHPRRVRRVPRVGARALASSIHPSIHARARDRADPGSGSNRDRAHLLFLGRLRGARDDDASGASSGVRGRVDRARLARVRDRSSRREHRRCLPPARARDGRARRARWVGARDVMSMGSEACTLCGCVSCVCVMVFRGV